ncbi:hypothetical protein IV203_017113 [Nitzschia inconspicua]|uniref:Uncharacterized protein n=1 Tax=Nitzschia inconspicua TaxID=303405 RepID=A0A9K3KST0_9STRA|nr:hypothetical protein IV203_017113 [Nitzschia inconspicua]
MSGRGRGNGRPGRGRNRFYRKAKSDASNKNPKEDKNKFDLNMANTEGKSFDEVQEEFITKMWSLYGTKVRKAMREGKHYDFDDSKNRPTMKVSTATDASTKAIEEKEYSASYSIALAQHMKDASIYNANMEKVNGLLWANCTTALKLKIKERPDYESKIEDDAVALINAIEERALGYDKAKAEKEVLFDTGFNLFNVRQKDDEDLASYNLRFISAIKLYDRHFGAQISLHNTVQKMKKIFPSKDEKEIQAEEWNRLLAYLFIYRSDQDKYGMFVENLKSQEAMGHKQFPDTVEESLQMLSGRTFEKKFYDKIEDGKKKVWQKQQTREA